VSGAFFFQRVASFTSSSRYARRNVATFSIENRVAGLIEARVLALPTLSEANLYAERLAAVVTQVAPNYAPVLCADHRPVLIYRQEVADRLSALFALMNSRLARVAVLVSRSNATLAMQLERIVREAKYPSRRVFYEAIEAERFLAPSLGDAATQQAHAFLDAWAPSASPPH
jgi:hypothetical protein